MLDNTQTSGQTGQLFFLPSLDGIQDKPSFPTLEKSNFRLKAAPMYVQNPTMPNTVVHVPSNIAQAIVEETTGEVVATVKGQHRLVQNDQLHKMVKDVLAGLIPDHWTVELREGVSGYGFTINTYGIPDYFGEIRQSNGITTTLSMQIHVVNAPNRAVTVFASMKDHSCGNDVIFTGAKATSPHLDSFNTHDLEEFIKEVMHEAADYMKMLQTWAHQEITAVQFKDLLRTQTCISPTLRCDLVDQFTDVEAPNRGANLYAAASALAAWGTHNEGRFYVRNSRNTDNEAESLFARQEKIMRVVGSAQWKAVTDG